MTHVPLIALLQLRIESRAVACLAATIACVLFASDARGQQRIAPNVIAQQPNGIVIQMPNSRVVSRDSGLQMEVDNRWINNYGYRPIGVRVTSPKPTTAKQVITVRLYLASNDWWTGCTAVQQEFVLPKGATSAKTTVSCPQYHTGHRLWWDVWVDGDKDKDLSISMIDAWQYVATSTPNLNTDHLKLLMVGNASQAFNTINPSGDLFEALTLTVSDLPERWIDYTAFDVIAFSPGDLAIIAESRPLALEAILRWVRSGGQLWVSNVGNEWQRLAEVEADLGFTADDAVDPQARGWQAIPLRSRRSRGADQTFVHLPTGRTRRVVDEATIDQLEQDPDWVVTTIDTVETSPRVDVGNADREADSDGAETDTSEWFLDQRLGMGTVRVFRRVFDPAGMAVSWQMLMGGEMPQYGSDDPSTPLEVAVGTMRTWELRHGMTPDTANYDFANLLVPGVGQAPVTEFRVMITLFVLAIGPANYWLLKRTNRLHLLVLTVPLLAGALTVALFGYALLSDGISTQVRVHSYTHLDQRTGDAACWSRISYYAGIAPSSGMTMPGDVAVYPIHSGWMDRTRGNPSYVERQMVWQSTDQEPEVEQRLAQGWLRSRTPTQYLTVRARQSPHELMLRPAKERLAATNKLGTAIQYVAAIDSDGDFFAGEEIADGGQVYLQPVSRLEVIQELRKIFLANEPEMPAGLADDSALLGSQNRRRRRAYRRSGWEFGIERLENNLPGEAVASILGNDGQPALELPPRSYVAITESGPEVVVGVPDAKSQASFHVLEGRW